MTATSVSAPRRLRSIQGLRGIAVLLVVLYHVGAPIGAGYVGVDVFFVISGFVITRLVLDRSASTMRLSLRDFWARRVRRLAPALALTILLTLLLSVPFASPVGVQSEVGITAVASVAWVANIVLAGLTFGYFADSADQNPLLHMWSLAVEEQFYLAFPLLVVAVLWWARKRGGGRNRLLAVSVAIVTVLSLGLSIALTYVSLPIGIGPTLAFYAPVTRAWEFGFGALVALAPGVASRRWAPWLSAAGGAILVAGLVLITDPSVFPGYIALLPVVGAALLCFAGSSHDDKVLASAPLVWLGDRSYGWYLFHWPLIVLAPAVVTKPGAALIGLLLAHWSLRYVEDPIRQRVRWPRLSAPRLWLVTSVPVVGVSLLLMFASTQHWWNSSVDSYTASVSRGVHPVQTTCQDVSPLTERDMSSCTFGPADDPSPVILVGDSNGGMYADMIVRAAEQADRQITIATIPSCQVADVATVRQGIRNSALLDCLDRYDDTIAWLSTQPASTVILASGASTPDLDDFALSNADHDVVDQPEAKQRAWQSSLERAYSAVLAQGHTVATVDLIPQWINPDGTAWSPRECRLVDVLRDTTQCGRTLSLDDMDERQSRTLAATREAAKAAGATIIGVRDLLCPDQECGTSRNGVGLYSDSAHLTPEGADLVESRFVAFLKRAER